MGKKCKCCRGPRGPRGPPGRDPGLDPEETRCNNIEVTQQIGCPAWANDPMGVTICFDRFKPHPGAGHVVNVVIDSVIGDGGGSAEGFIETAIPLAPEGCDDVTRFRPKTEQTFPIHVYQNSNDLKVGHLIVSPTVFKILPPVGLFNTTDSVIGFPKINVVYALD